MRNAKHGLKRLAERCAVAVGAAVMATSAHATVLTNIQGSVMVDRGSGFQPVSVTSPVVAGDRVRAIGGSADIVYNDGLVQKVQSQTVAVLSRGGAGSGPDEQGGFSGDLPLIGAALGVGIGAGVALATNDSDDDGGFGFSVSP